MRQKDPNSEVLALAVIKALSAHSAANHANQANLPGLSRLVSKRCLSPIRVSLLINKGVNPSKTRLKEGK